MFNACSLYNSYAENFYLYKAYFNQSPYDEVIGKLGKENWALVSKKNQNNKKSHRYSGVDGVAVQWSSRTMASPTDAIGSAPKNFWLNILCRDFRLTPNDSSPSDKKIGCDTTCKRKFLAPEPVVSLSEGFGWKSQPGNGGVGRLRQCVYNVGREFSLFVRRRDKKLVIMSRWVRR